MADQTLNDQEPQRPRPPNRPSLDELRRERDALQDRLLRTAAEFDNYRKRVERDRRELSEFAAADAMLETCCRSSTTSSAPCRRRPVAMPTRSQGRGADSPADARPAAQAGGQADRGARHRFRSERPSGGRARSERRTPRRRGHAGAAARLHAGRSAAAPGDGEGGETLVSKRDYYEVLSVVAHCDRAGDQERVPQAGAELPSRPQSRRPCGRREVQGSGRGVRGARRRRQAAHVRPLRPCRTGRRRHGGFDPNVFTGFEDILGGLGDIFGFSDVFGGGRRRGGPQRGADLRYDLEISFEESAATSKPRFRSRGRRPARRAAALAPPKGAAPTTCPQCHGRGQLRYQQGFFTVARTCGQCRGTGSIIAKPCATCRGAGRVQKERKLTVQIPAGIATGPAAPAHRRRRSRRRRAAPAAICTS